jgi:hypothetical protein
LCCGAGPSSYFRGRRLASTESALAAEMVHSASRGAPVMSHAFDNGLDFHTSYTPSKYYFWDPRS